ncbi:LytTR family DNA-binding domain-containing protein [Xylanibacter caecicola]|uniref:LytTR family DNA-binding domain-containing protein n=1 Tax=Xylanibacter caecicola TaxID=2736294 RepID=UPI00258D4ED0|nr:LytTR family DNA-binding domain-containing protein [Xylanibacter caecicola]
MKNYIYFNTRDELLRIDTSKIVYFEADGNYTNIFFENKTQTQISLNLSQMQQLLSRYLNERARIFARIGKRHIININYIFHIQVLRQNLTLSNGSTFSYNVSISKEALRQLKDMIKAGTGSFNAISDIKAHSDDMKTQEMKR